jgi:LmbE family N-acetylglucosaminyl deacetylase
MTRSIAAFLLALLLALAVPSARAVTVEGAPSNSGYNAGSEALIRVTLKDLEAPAGRYAVFADIQYLGAASGESSEMTLLPGPTAGETRYETRWAIPTDAATGIYGVSIRVEDRSSHKVVASQKLRGFAVYRKVIQITRVGLNKTFYTAGDPIRCEVSLENLTGKELKNLRVEFSNANYPWISLFSGEKNLSGSASANPALALHVIRASLDLPPHGSVTIPMQVVGTAAFTQGAQVSLLGHGSAARHEKTAPPEVDTYTIAVWSPGRTRLYDMQFTDPAIIRPWNHDQPKPYDLNYTHPYNSDIDFTNYREFYPPGYISAVIHVNRAHTLFRPGDAVETRVTFKNPGAASWNGLILTAEVRNAHGAVVHESSPASHLDLVAGASRAVEAQVWKLPQSAAPGVYKIAWSLKRPNGESLAHAASEFAVNDLPASLLVVAPHEDDEHFYAGLIRAYVEAGLPVRVLVMTGGDVGECERYYSKPCGPNEAREFGMVRMAETADALEHIGLPRDKLIFLGLPDGGSGEIWFHHLKPSDPFLSIYLACDHAPYEDVLIPNLPFARDSVLEALEGLLIKYHPALLGLPHPDERHVDHRTTNWFVIKACQELLKQGKIDPHTIVLADQTYGAGGYKPAPYHYERAPVYLSGEVSALKQEMSWIYQSQDGNLAEGNKRTFEQLPREEVHYLILDWQKHEGWNE